METVNNHKEQLSTVRTERKFANEAFQKIDKEFLRVFDTIQDHISMIDKNHTIIYLNDVAKQMFGEDIVGKKCFSAYYDLKSKCKPCRASETFLKGKIQNYETEIIGNDGKIQYFWTTSSVLFRDEKGKPSLIVEHSRDITKKKQLEDKIRHEYKEVEEEVKKRTKDLIKLNEKFKAEIENRKIIEVKLKEKSNHLTEVNIALKVLLQQRENDKFELEEKILSNVKELIIPYIRRLKNSKLVNRQRTLIDIVESNLNNIISPFVHRLGMKIQNITPMEMQVADLVKQGLTNQEIADTLYLSKNTILFHRHNLRKKLGLTNRKANLQTCLMTINK